jgi:large subunit ribosomal protein L4
MAIKIKVKDMRGREGDTVELPADIFEAPINVGLMHQAYVRQMANARLSLASTKTRGEVNRTKAKWFRQKGTGRARHGARSAPSFVGGGVAHGPNSRKYTKDMPKKMHRAALRSALSAKAADGEIILISELALDAPKTRDMAEAIRSWVGNDNSALVLLASANDNVERSMRNLDDARYLRASYLNVRDLLKYDKLVMPLDALEVIKNWLSKPVRSE